MKNNYSDQSYSRNAWDGNARYAEPYNGDDDENYDDYGDNDDYDDYGDYEDDNLDRELDSEHNFRIAMNVFNLIALLIGLGVILVLTALLFSLFNWVQRDISQSLSVITAPFR